MSLKDQMSGLLRSYDPWGQGNHGYPTQGPQRTSPNTFGSLHWYREPPHVGHLCDQTEMTTRVNEIPEGDEKKRKCSEEK